MSDLQIVIEGPPQQEGEMADKRRPMSGRCLHHVFEERVQEYPDNAALTFGETTLTYRALNARANQLAHYLQEQGVGPETLVGLCVDRTIDIVVGILGILKAGGAYVPLDAAYPPDRLAYMLEDARVPVLISRTGLKPDLVTHQANIVLLDSDREEIGRQATENPESGVSPDNLMYVIYTSGSTGKPKGIMVTHENVARLFDATRPYLHFDAKDSWTLFHSYSFGFSVWEIWGALAHGARLVIVPQATSQSIDDFYELVCRERITVLSQTPSAFSLFLLADSASNRSGELNLRYIVFSGERLEHRQVESWIKRHGDERPRLINMYAITETAGEITYRRLTAQDSAGTRNVIGVPLPDVQIHILDEERQAVLNGTPGEMYVSGAMVARGYFNLPDLTGQKFLLHEFNDRKPARIYKTGDRARYLANGEIEFLGRVDDQVKIRGYRVELAEIQSALAAHPAIQEAVVVAQSDTGGETRLLAYIVPHSTGNEAALTTAELQSHLKAALPEYMIPGVFVTLDRLPRSPNGKIDRAKLPPPGESVETVRRYKPVTSEEQALAGIWGLDSGFEAPLAPAEDAYVEPRTSVEKTVAQIWQSVLGIGRIGLQNDFLELGGNSLSAAQVLHRTNEAFGVSLSLRQFFDAGSLAGVALLITRNQAELVDPEELSSILAGLAESSEEEAREFLASQADRETGVEAVSRPSGIASGEALVEHERFMRLAIGKAQEAIRGNQIPIAACVVKDGQVVACVHNSVRRDMDATAHAEVQAIREACRQLNTTDLSGCVLYSTLEPCPMCFSACNWAHISRVGYGARRGDAEKVGLIGAGTPVQAVKDLLHSPIELVKDILRDDNLRVFDLWLESRGIRSSQYDRIAGQFQRARISPVNKHIVDHTFFEMVGELHREKSVLDLACGEGHYCRILKRRGAARVAGVDISAEMIKLAEQRERSEPLGIDYICRDVLELGKIGEFDLVVASFLLNYAKTKAQLVKMCRTVSENLKPGGQFILLNENFNQSPRDFDGYERYGYAKKMAHPGQEGAVITYTMSTGAEELRFDGYYWSKATYLEAFETAGFASVIPRNLSCSPEGIEEYGHRFWQPFLDNPPFIGIMCRK